MLYTYKWLLAHAKEGSLVGNVVSDIYLILRVQQKDIEALKVLYDRYERVLFSQAMKILNNPQEAEEVVQDVFLKLWNKSALFDPGKPYASAWLLRICRNTAIDKLKRRRRNEYIEDKENMYYFTMDVNDEIELNQIKEQIREALNMLPSEQKEVIELIYFEGLSQAETATKLNIPLGTVKSRTRLAMARLKKFLVREERNDSGRPKVREGFA